jgi:hypothetical protein
MNITEHLQKDYWKRRINPDMPYQNYPFLNVSDYKGTADTNHRLLTQDDFLNEIYSSAHAVNSSYMSRRPIYEPTGEKDKNGKEKWKIARYDDVEVVPLGLQNRFAESKASFFAADGFGVANETEDTERFNTMMSHKDSTGLDVAFLQAIISCFKTGDGGIYLYQTSTGIEYKVYSYLDGYTIFSEMDENRKPVHYVKYVFKGRTAVDIFSTEAVETWIHISDDEETSRTFLSKIKGWLKGDVRPRSDDGYVRVSRTENQAGNDMTQFVYFRVNDIPSGPAEQSICALERALSYVAEEVKNSAFPILFVKSEKIVNLPPSRMNGKVLGVKGTSETVRNSDAKFLAGPDASNISEINIKALTDNILRSTLSVFIDPDILKSGADSSTTIKIMYAPEIQWCQNMWVQIFPSVKMLMELFKRLVGKFEGDPIGYGQMRLSVWQRIWLPQNESERVKIEIDQVMAKVKSRKAAMQDIGNSYKGDYEQIMEEWKEELRIKAEIPAEVKAKYGSTEGEEGERKDGEEILKVDNRFPGKTVTQ